MLKSRGRPVKVSGTMLSLLLRLLAFKPDRDLNGKVIGGHFAKTRSEHAHALRNAALGVMSCMELQPEQALQYADLEEVEQDAAARKLQGLRRGQIMRRRMEAEAMRKLEYDSLEQEKDSTRSSSPSPPQPPAPRKRRGSVSRDHEELPPPAAVPEKVIPPKILPTQLLGLLEELISAPATRFTECCAAALCSLVTKPTVSSALAAADALSRILTLCAMLQTQSPLGGHASVAHGYLAASALSLLDARLQRMAEKAANPDPPPPPTATLPPPPPPETKSKRDGGAKAPLSPSTVEAESALVETPAVTSTDDDVALTEGQLGVLVGILPASHPGALHGSAALWLMANAGFSENLGRLGAVEACAGALAVAVDEKKLQGNYLLQASWTCAALWRLAHEPTNAARMLACAAPTLLKLLPEGSEEHDTLRKAALGCVSLMLRQPELQPPLVHMAAPSLLRDLAMLMERPIEQRLTATRTLDKAVVNVGHHLLPDPPQPIAGLGEGGEGTEGAVVEGGDGGDAAAESSGMELLMLSLLNDKNTDLRALGCRGLARAAMRGAEKRIVHHGGCKALMAILRTEAERYLAEEADTTAPTVIGAPTPARPAQTAPAGLGGTGRSPRAALAQSAADLAAAQAEAGEKAAVSAEDSSLLRDALNAVLNLSGAKCGQQQLARHGLWTLVQIWYTAQQKPPGSELAELASMAGGILVNLACHPANRTLMYRAELQLKTAACSGLPLRTRPATPPPPPAREEGMGDDEAMEAEDTGLDIEAEVAADGADSAMAPAGSSVPEETGPKPVKQRYLDWLTSTMKEVDADRARDRREAQEAKKREEAEHGQDSAVLARDAFRIIDSSNDGELTRTEVIRAFRLNDQVRQLLLPLLPAELLGKSNSAVSGVDVQAQVEAFEVTFQRMDVDGSNAVTLQEFEDYFTSIAVHGGSVPPPKKNNMQPKKGRGRKRAAGLQVSKRDLVDKPADVLMQSSSRDSLPAIKGTGKGGKGGKGGKAPIEVVPMKEGLKAPGLQRLMQTSFTDTWRKPVSLPTSTSGRNRGMTSPRSEAMLRSGAASTMASARAELSEMSLGGGSSPANLGRRSNGHGTLQPIVGAPSTALVMTDAVPEGSDGPWAPPIEAIDLMAEVKKPKSTRPEWEQEYLAGETPLRFEVRLPASAEYTPKFRFKGDEAAAMQDTRSGGMGGKLVYWQAAAPAKLSNRVAKHVGHKEVGSEVARLCGFTGFKLPNGKELRLFHASTKRNWKAPAQEPVEPLPDTLATLGLPTLPPHPPPPQPSRRDVQKLSQPDPRAPKPRKEKQAADGADAASAAYSYGDTEIETETLTFIVRQSAKDLGLDLPKTKGKDAPFDLFESPFAPRRITSDGKTFYDDEQVSHRAFEIDFARCNQERFRLLIREEDDDTADGDGDPSTGGGSESTEIGEIKDVLCRHRNTFYSAFRYFSGLSAIHERGDGFSIGPEDFEAFIKECEIADESSSMCTFADLQEIFNTTNEEEEALEEQKEMAAVNVDHALLRFEFMQSLVRIAIAKYVHGGEENEDGGGRRRRPKKGGKKIADVSEALEVLLTKDIAPNLPAEGQVVPDVFRRGRLYTRGIADAAERAEAQLRAIFDFYAATGDDPDAEAAKPTVRGAEIYARELNLSMDEWFTMLEDAQLIDEPVDGKPAGFDRRAAVFCFLWSSTFVTDEVKRREKMQNLNFVDFIEALARVCTFKGLPSSELLKTWGARSCAHFFLQEEQGVHEGRKLCKPPVNWQEKEVSSSSSMANPLRQPFEMLISLIFERLSTTAEDLTKAQLKERLVARSDAKRDAAEAKRLAEEEAPPKFFSSITAEFVGATKRAEMS